MRFFAGSGSGCNEYESETLVGGGGSTSVTTLHLSKRQTMILKINIILANLVLMDCYYKFLNGTFTVFRFRLAAPYSR